MTKFDPSVVKASRFQFMGLAPTLQQAFNKPTPWTYFLAPFGCMDVKLLMAA
jgi:hypothetical protein